MKIFSAVLIYMVISSLSLSAQWVSGTGPYGADVMELAIKDRMIFAGTKYGGVFKSTDNGDNWKEANAGLRTRNIRQILMNNNTLFISTENGIFRSMDYAETWTNISTDSLKAVSHFAVDGTTVFASEPHGGLWYTTDNGDTWMNTKMTEEVINGIFVDDSRLYVALDYSLVVLRSMDRGKTSDTIIAPGPFQRMIKCGTLLFSTVAGGTKVYSSSDYGNSWLRVDTGLPNVGTPVYLTSVDTTLYAGTQSYGVYKSTDYGHSWKQFRREGMSNLRVNVLAINDSMLFAGTWTCPGGGIYSIAFEGEKWTYKPKGMSSLFISSFAQKGDTLYTGIYDGLTYSSGAVYGGAVFKSTDNGANWTDITSNLPHYPIRCVTATDKMLFAGMMTKGLYRSSNEGASWEAVNPVWDGNDIQRMITVDSLVFIGLRSNGVFKSTNNGTNWISANKGLEEKSIRSLIVNGTTLYAGTENGGVFKSTDNGDNWIKLSLGGVYAPELWTLAVVDTVVAAGAYNSRVYRILEPGKSEEIDTKLKGANIITLFAAGTNLLAGIEAGGIILSRDLGQSWEQVYPDLDYKSFSAFYSKGDILFAGTHGSSILKNSLKLLAVPENKNVSISVNGQLICFPNPATNTLTIDRTSLQFSENTPVHYTLSTLIGGRVMEFDNSESKFTIPLEGMTGGVYCLTAVSGGNRAAVMVTVVE